MPFLDETPAPPATNPPANHPEKTMKLKHTSGPWKISKGGFFIGGTKAVALIVSNETSKRETAANEFLIAAAPDMLDALNLARDKFRSYQIHHYTKKAFDKAYANQKIADYLQIVIDKATGQQPEENNGT